jgi:hypothetical protein
MSLRGRFVFVGLFAISGAALCACSSDKEADTVGGNGAATAGTSGSQSPVATGGSQTTGVGGASAGGTQKTNTGGKSAGGSGGKAGGKAGANAGTGGQGGSGGVAGSTGAKPDAGASGGVRPVATSLSLPTTMDEFHDVAPYFVVYRPADLDAAVAATGQLLPVIVWGNGGCYRYSSAWTTMFDRWAGAGFVILAIDSGPDGNPMTMHSADEHDALVDRALEKANEQGSPYAGKLDTNRIVSSGNSCGGVTALTVASMDKRVTAVYVLSGSSALGSTDVNAMGAINVPVGYTEGGTEDISRAAAESDYAALPEGVPAMIAARSSGDHVTISFTDQTIVGQEAEIALNWMDLCLYGTKEAYDALTSDPICTGCEAGLYTFTSKNIEKLKK